MRQTPSGDFNLKEREKLLFDLQKTTFKHLDLYLCSLDWLSK